VASSIEPDTTTSLQRGIEALEQGELEEAYHLLSQGLEEDRGSGTATELNLRFYSGLTLQRQAAESTTNQTRIKRLGEAAAFYERALEIDPGSGGSLNNLAQVYVDLGRDADAERVFERAVALDVRLRPFYNRNYADFLAHLGDWIRAEEHYRKALEEEPDDLQSHKSLVVVLSEHRPEGLPEYLWFLIGHGQMLWAEKEALKRLEQGKEYLTILVASLAEQSYRPEDFSASQAAQTLRALSGRSDIGEGAREVLRLHEGQDFDPKSYRWWAEKGQTSGIFVGQPTPRQAFRHLLRSLGEAEQKAERYDVARRYFRLSILLTPAEPDLLAFRMLVNLPSSSEDVAAIDRLADWNEGLLRPKPDSFTGLFVETTGWKQALSRQANTATQADLYLYRHDLGLLYSFFRRWDGKGPTSGIYQLSQATQMGGVGPPDGPPDTPTFDARIYTRLAAGYADTGKPEQAKQTLYNLIDAYRSHGLGDEANALQVVLKSSQGRHRPPDRRREVFDDPPLRLQDFTTEPPGRPPL
jgi:tetratricopeptide (TPR) repeat protein